MGFRTYFEEGPTRLARGWAVEGEKRGIKDDFSVLTLDGCWCH